MSATTYVLIALSLLLLWFPRNWLRLGLRVTPKPPRKYNQAKRERDPYDRAVKPLAEAAKPRNWLDFFRALIGTCVVVDLVDRHSAELGTANAEMSLVAAVLAFGVLVQMIRIEGRLSFFAPIFFLQGMCIGLNGPVLGLIVMAGTWALSPVLPSAGALLFVQSAITLCLGFLIKGAEPVVAGTMAAITCAPALISVLLRKRLAASFEKKLKIVPRDAEAN